MNVSVNGKIVPQKDALITIADKAVWYDFGVYENIKVLQGTLIWPDLHVARLLKSAEIIGLEMGEGRDEILQWVREYAEREKLKDHLIKLCAYGDADKNTRATVYIFSIGLTFYPDQFYAKGVKAVTCRGERNFPNAKSMDTLVNYIAFREARSRDAFEAILIDHEGNAREGSRSNLYIVEKDTVITPPLSDVLEGVTRILVLRLLQENNIPFKEERISKSRLYGADEVFITATSSNVMPVAEVDAHRIGQGKPGEVTKKIIQLYRAMQKKSVGEG
ncbi:MAG: aminotransferase class IV [Patescibacteria group bacterium]